MRKLKNVKALAVEIGKWLLVLWLLLPIAQAYRGPVDFTRIALGILLFILFTGKVFYDTIISPRKSQRERSALQEVLLMVGVVAVIALVVGAVIVFVAMYLFEMMSQSAQTV